MTTDSNLPLLQFLVIFGVGGSVVLFFVFRTIRRAKAQTRRLDRLQSLMSVAEPIRAKLKAGEEIAPAEIRRLAERAETRGPLEWVLHDEERLDLVPPEFNTPQSRAEALLAVWIVRFDRFARAAETIELAATETRPFEGRLSKFFVFRYRMPGDKGDREQAWNLGVAGPFRDEDASFAEAPGVYLYTDEKHRRMESQELVDEFVQELAKNPPAKG